MINAGSPSPVILKPPAGLQAPIRLLGICLKLLGKSVRPLGNPAAQVGDSKPLQSLPISNSWTLPAFTANYLKGLPITWGRPGDSATRDTYSPLPFVLVVVTTDAKTPIRPGRFSSTSTAVGPILIRRWGTGRLGSPTRHYCNIIFRQRSSFPLV